MWEKNDAFSRITIKYLDIARTIINDGNYNWKMVLLFHYFLLTQTYLKAKMSQVCCPMYFVEWKAWTQSATILSALLNKTCIVWSKIKITFDGDLFIPYFRVSCKNTWEPRMLILCSHIEFSQSQVSQSVYKLTSLDVAVRVANLMQPYAV